MTTYYLYIPKSVRKKIQKIPIQWQNRIIRDLTLLKTDPYLGEKMRGKYGDCYRIKVWPYRIVYKIKQTRLMIHIVEVDHRSGISYD